MEKPIILLDCKIAHEYHLSAIQTEEYPCDYGEMHQLRIELQSLCGITEIEALNILVNKNVSDYICKYNGRTVGYRLEEKRPPYLPE